MATTSLILGCGYLGGRVAPLWQQQGRRVFAATRNATLLPSPGTPGEGLGVRAGSHTYRNSALTPGPSPGVPGEGRLPANVEPIVCDVLDPASLRALPHVDTVLYAIGFDRTSGATMRAVYVEGLANVLAHLPTPKRFIYISSSSVYGQTDGGWVDEMSPTQPQEPSGQIVLEAENVLRAKMPAAIILRFAGIYGPGRLLRRQTIEKGEPIVGDADKWLNLIHVEDGARAILAAEELGQPGLVYNVCDDHPVRRRYFYATMARLLGAAEPRFESPPPDQPTPPHECANRRLNNRRMKSDLHVSLAYPDYGLGLRACNCGN